MDYTVTVTSNRTYYFIDLEMVVSTEPDMECGIVQYEPGTTHQLKRLRFGESSRYAFQYSRQVPTDNTFVCWNANMLLFTGSCQLDANSSVTFLIVGVRFYASTFAAILEVGVGRELAFIMTNYATD